MMVAKMIFLDGYCGVELGSKTRGRKEMKGLLEQELSSE
jgi:hypothetical protein